MDNRNDVRDCVYLPTNLNATYEFMKLDFEVNDGKHLTFIDDREEK